MCIVHQLHGHQRWGVYRVRVAACLQYPQGEFFSYEAEIYNSFIMSIFRGGLCSFCFISSGAYSSYVPLPCTWLCLKVSDCLPFRIMSFHIKHLILCFFYTEITFSAGFIIDIDIFMFTFCVVLYNFMVIINKYFCYILKYFGKWNKVILILSLK